MPRPSYSDLIREERERNGFDLTEMSRRLHIRPDILHSIESGDFARMPARGYSKNMVRAYARSLGLDERQITKMYLDEVQSFETADTRFSNNRGYRFERPARSTRQTVYSRPVSQLHGASRHLDASISSSAYPDIERADTSSSQNTSRGRRAGRNSRTVRDEKPSKNQRNNRNSSPNNSKKLNNQKQKANSVSITENVLGGVSAIFGMAGRRQENKIPRSFNTIGSTPPYAQQRSSSRVSQLDGLNLPLVLAIVAALIIVLIVIVVITNGAKQSNEQLPSIPISGLTDTSNPESSAAVSAAPKPPTSVSFEYTIKEGKKVWIEVYENGSANPVIAAKEEGPKTQTFEVTDILEFKTSVPSAVVCKLDGKVVELTSNSKGDYIYEVDFKKYLEQWEIENGLREASSSSKSSASSASKSSASSSSKSSSASSKSTNSSSKATSSKSTSSSAKSSSKSSSSSKASSATKASSSSKKSS